jgi:four helix bundle protein
VIIKFTDLDVWQEAHKLTLFIYKITNKFPKTERYGLISQLRRAAVSVEACIAEGFSRFHYKDRLNFYYDARGSLGEVESEIIDAKDLEFITKDDFKTIAIQIETTGKILGGLIRSTEKLSGR